MKPTKSRTIDVKDLAEKLDVTPSTIRNRARRGRYTLTERGKIALTPTVRAEIALRKPIDPALARLSLTPADIAELKRQAAEREARGDE